MTSAPPAAEPQISNDPVPAMLEASWESLSEQLQEEEERFATSLNSPLAKSSDPAMSAVQRNILDETVALFVHAALECQIRLAFIHKNRAIPQGAIAAIAAATTAFAKALSDDAKLVCSSTKCDWTGGPAEAGPIGKCPKCSERARMLPPQQKILGPTGAVLEA